MRPCYTLLLALACAVACINGVYAEAATNTVTAFNDEKSPQRFLRAVAATENDEDTEERAITDALKNWRLKQSIKSATKASARVQKATVKETAALEKVEKKIMARLPKWLDDDKVPPKIQKYLLLDNGKVNEGAVKNLLEKHASNYEALFKGKWASVII